MQTSSFDDTIPYIIYHPGSVRQVLFLENQNTPDVIPGHELVVYIMKYVYKTKGTCSTLIELELEGNIVHNVKFTGGCNGNLQAIPKLVEGLTVEQVEQKIGGISCNGRGTSCGDQLAKACREAYEAEQK